MEQGGDIIVTGNMTWLLGFKSPIWLSTSNKFSKFLDQDQGCFIVAITKLKESN